MFLDSYKGENMNTITKTVACLCILGLSVGIGGGCWRTDGSGSRKFSQGFDSEKIEDLTTAAKMYDSLCRELESRDFKEMKVTEDPEMKNSLYEGEYDGFPLTIETRYLLSISKEDPEFFYRVSFEQTTDVANLDKAAKDFRVLMTEWCEI
jgi:hypothetical protein